MNPTWKDVMKFELKENPIIFDLGGYLGDWTQISKEYYNNSTVYVFEPVKKNYDIIVNRFINDSSVKVFNFGLSDKNDIVKISLTGDSSSMHISDDSNYEDVEIRDIREFLFENNIFSVDLIKINIEGEEYNLLEHIFLFPENYVDDYSNDWQWLIHAQHYELPTRLMDWSSVYNTALYFIAMNENNYDGESVFCGYF